MAPAAGAEATEGLGAELWRTRAWRLFPLLLAYMSGEPGGVAAQQAHVDAAHCLLLLPGRDK